MMMDLLHINSLRRGADGNNPQSPYYQNTNEAKANPYPNLPDPLVLKNGTKVTTPAMWWKGRRPEIVEDFDREVYGRVPNNVPRVNWEVTSTTKTNSGELAFRQPSGGHTTGPNWPIFLNWADRYIKGPAVVAAQPAAKAQ